MVVGVDSGIIYGLTRRVQNKKVAQVQVPARIDLNTTSTPSLFPVHQPTELITPTRVRRIFPPKTALIVRPSFISDDEATLYHLDPKILSILGIHSTHTLVISKQQLADRRIYDMLPFAKKLRLISGLIQLAQCINPRTVFKKIEESAGSGVTTVLDPMVPALSAEDIEGIDISALLIKVLSQPGVVEKVQTDLTITRAAPVKLETTFADAALTTPEAPAAAPTPVPPTMEEPKSGNLAAPTISYAKAFKIGGIIVLGLVVVVGSIAVVYFLAPGAFAIAGAAILASVTTAFAAVMTFATTTAMPFMAATATQALSFLMVHIMAIGCVVAATAVFGAGVAVVVRASRQAVAPHRRAGETAEGEEMRNRLTR
ncbi:MAG: hypothetical protein KBD64_02575 [Gammaproteobacteria bacterium]|nr:hypothetical protein [Gammaproteobacteria bacterium]